MNDIKQAVQHANFLTSRYEDGRGTGHEGALTWDEYLKEVDHYFGMTRKDDWQKVAAWLAAQLVGSRALTHADTHRAVLEIASIIHRYEDERRVVPIEAPQDDQSSLDLGGAA